MMTALVCSDVSFTPSMQACSGNWYDRPVESRPVISSRVFHDVWDSNFEEEFDAFLAVVSGAGGPKATIAMDMEFPGFLCEDPQFSTHAEHYQALRYNVDRLWPIQVGLAVAGANGVIRGVWIFNLRFDAGVDAHTDASLAFLRDAGIDFPRHSEEGISALRFGQQLSSSTLVGHHGHAPHWLTFSGSYDWGYMLKLVTSGRDLPGLPSGFDDVLSVYCPKRHDLQDLLPRCSLQTLGRWYGVKRWGSAHTAGSDALLTLELFLLVGCRKPPGTASENRIMRHQTVWSESDWPESRWQHWETLSFQWHEGDDQQYSADGYTSSDEWNSSAWVDQNWLMSSAIPSRSQAWYPSGFESWPAKLL
jgi:hypothetical protein